MTYRAELSSERLESRVMLSAGIPPVGPSLGASLEGGHHLLTPAEHPRKSPPFAGFDRAGGLRLEAQNHVDERTESQEAHKFLGAGEQPAGWNGSNVLKQASIVLIQNGFNDGGEARALWIRLPEAPPARRDLPARPDKVAPVDGSDPPIARAPALRQPRNDDATDPSANPAVFPALSAQTRGTEAAMHAVERELATPGRPVVAHPANTGTAAQLTPESGTVVAESFPMLASESTGAAVALAETPSPSAVVQSPSPTVEATLAHATPNDSARMFQFAHLGSPLNFLQDSLASFVEESASLPSFLAAVEPKTAWWVTVFVIAADVVLLSYVHRRGRTPRKHSWPHDAFGL